MYAYARRTTHDARVPVPTRVRSPAQAKFVVADALYIAHVLGRTLVEPRVAHARLAAPANGSANARSGRGGDGARLSLHHYFDLQPLCARFALVPARDFERRRELRALWRTAAVVRPRCGRAFPGGWRLHTPTAVRQAFAHAASARLIVLDGLWRSVTNSEIAHELAPLPHAGLATPLRPADWEPNPGYALLARQLLDAFVPGGGGGRGLLAIQWRSEDWEKNGGGGGGGGGGGSGGGGGGGGGEGAEEEAALASLSALGSLLQGLPHVPPFVCGALLAAPMACGTRAVRGAAARLAAVLGDSASVASVALVDQVAVLRLQAVALLQERIDIRHAHAHAHT